MFILSISTSSLSSSDAIAVLVEFAPGKHLAHSILTLAAASILLTFDLEREVDENGWEIEPKQEYTKSSALR